jgi:DtxR family Mn-dependent transcriptional regulator
MTDKQSDKQVLDDLSSKMQVYLAKIYRLADFGTDPHEFVTTSALADTLFVTAPAVNRMVNRLKEAGLLEHEPYKGIRLTDEGRREALKHLRNQRIAETFLMTVMHLGWAEAYEEANTISTALSSVIVERMWEMCDKPDYCPHGEPIPNADGTIRVMDDILLSHAQAGQTVQVTRMKTREIDRLKYIEALGLVPNAKLEVLHVHPFNGPMQLKVKNEYRIVGSNLAELIRVRVV